VLLVEQVAVLQLTGLLVALRRGNVVYKLDKMAVTLALANTQEHLDTHGSDMT
jgi:hypothetical protein